MKIKILYEKKKMENFIYKLIDNIDNIGNDYIIPFFLKFFSHLKDKVFFLKVIIYDYSILQNWFINILTISLIFTISDTNILGALWGAILTFNLINGYSYYTKYLQWQEIKKLFLSHLHEFLFKHIIYLQYHRFPFTHNSIVKEHLMLDNDLSKIEAILGFSNGNKILLINMYKSYEDLLQKLINLDFVVNEDLLDHYMQFINTSNNRLNQSLTLSMIFFTDNTKFLIRMQEINNTLIGMCDDYNQNLYKTDPKFFLKDNIKIINNLNNLIIHY